MNQKKSGLTKFVDVLTVADKTTQTFRLEALFEASFEGIDTQESKAIAATLRMLECLCVRPQTDLAMASQPTCWQSVVRVLQRQQRMKNRRLRSTGYYEVNVLRHQDFIKPEGDRAHWNCG